MYYEVGKKVRKAIADIGSMMPEDMPTPKKSLKKLERKGKQLELKQKIWDYKIKSQKPPTIPFLTDRYVFKNNGLRLYIWKKVK